MIEVGQIIQTNNGQVCVTDKPNSRFVQIVFLEPPYSMRTVQIANLLKGSVANKPDTQPFRRDKRGRKPKHPTVGENGRVSPAYSIWSRMKTECRYGSSTMCADWMDYQTFADWYARQIRPTNEFRWTFTHRLFNAENRHYSPETCHVLPGPIVRTAHVGSPAAIVRAIEHHRKWLAPETYNRLTVHFSD